MNAASIVACIGHDPDALDAFYRAHIELVERFVARRCRPRHDCQHRHRNRTGKALPAGFGHGTLIEIATTQPASERSCRSHQTRRRRRTRSPRLAGTRRLLAAIDLRGHVS
jgi:hypothetical protein